MIPGQILAKSIWTWIKHFELKFTIFTRTSGSGHKNFTAFLCRLRRQSFFLRLWLSKNERSAQWCPAGGGAFTLWARAKLWNERGKKELSLDYFAARSFQRLKLHRLFIIVLVLLSQQCILILLRYSAVWMKKKT